MRNFTQSKFLTTRLSSEKERANRYFLGELSETEQNAVEECFFADEDYSRFLDAAENYLIDDYLKGKLDFRQARNFQRNFLISERRREKVRSARILQLETFAAKEESTLPASPPVSVWRQLENLFRVPRPAWAGGLAAVAILIALGGWRLVNSPEKNQTAKIDTDSQTIVESSEPVLVPTNEKTPDSNAIQKQTVARQLLKVAAKLNLENQWKQQVVPREKSKPISTFTLLSPMRSAGKQLIVKANEAEKIHLRLAPRGSESFIKYLVEIRAADGDLIWSREIAVNKNTARKPVALDVRSGALVSGSYGLTMSGATDDGRLEEIQSYNFSVRQK